LLTLVEEGPAEEYGNAQWCLERITFRRDVQGLSGWQTWFKNNGGKSRHQWMQEASFELIQLAHTNIPAADAFLDKATYRWKDPLMFDTMDALAAHQQLHNHIVGWIDLTYGQYHCVYVPPFFFRQKRTSKRLSHEDERCRTEIGNRPTSVYISHPST